MTIARRIVRTALLASAAFLLASAAFGVAVQSSPSPTPFRSGTLPRGIPEARLEALDPAGPEDYFDLAEDVADRATGEDERQLARELFALAGVLDPERLGVGAALSLYDLARTDAERRRLLVLARRLEAARAGGPLRPGAAVRERDPEMAAAISAALAHRRLGEGRAARRRLDEAAAVALAERVLAELPGGWEAFAQSLERLEGDGATLPASRAARLRELRVERRMLSGESASVVEDLVVGQGRPLIEIDLDRLDLELGMDRGLAWWRRGRWTDRP